MSSTHWLFRRWGTSTHLASVWLKLFGLMPVAPPTFGPPRQPKQPPCLGHLCCGNHNVPVCHFCGRPYPIVTFSASQTNRWLTYRRSVHLKNANSARHVGCQSCFPSQTGNEWKRCSMCGSSTLSGTQKHKPKGERKCLLCVASEEQPRSALDILYSLRPETVMQLLAFTWTPPMQHESWTPAPDLVPKFRHR